MNTWTESRPRQHLREPRAQQRPLVAPIEASQRTSSRSIFGRFSSTESYLINPVEKGSNTPFEPLSEIKKCYT